MFELRVLGGLDLRTAEGVGVPSVLAQPKRAGLLTCLALVPAHGFIRRDTLLATFWPELDDEHARAALRQAVYHLRQTLGEQAIVARGHDELAISETCIDCDAVAFEHALDAGHPEAALPLYRGQLLEGFFLRDAPAFEEWVERERARLRARAASGAWDMAERCAAQGGGEEVARWGERALQLADDDEALLRRLLRLLERTGDRVTAIRIYESFVERLRGSYEIDPSTETREIAASIRERAHASAPSQAAVDRPARSPLLRRRLPAQPVVHPEAVAPPAADPTSAAPADAMVREEPLAPNAVGSAHGRYAVAVAGWLTAIVLGIVLAILVRTHTAAAAREGTQRLDLLLPDSAPLDFMAESRLGIGRPALTISPDGSTIVYVARRPGSTGTQLYVRRLDEETPRALPETDDGYQPFFSPDGRWIGFLHGRELRKVSVAGGHVATIATANEPTGAFWASDGRILLADKEGMEMRWVPADGNASYPLAPAPEARFVQLPQILPGGKWMLHGSYDRALYVTSLATGRAYVITSDGVVPRDSADLGKLYYGENPVYVRSGHLLYLSGSGGPLMALPFDAATMRVLGRPEPVLTGMRQEADIGAGQFAVSDSGTLVYAPGVDASVSRFVFVDSTGQRQLLRLPARSYGPFQLSPDGTRILVRVQNGNSIAELWVLEIATGRYAPIPVPAITSYLARWWPDGKRVLTWNYIWKHGGTSSLLLLPTSGDGPIDTILPSAVSAEPSPDGKRLLVGGYPGPGLWLITIGGGARPVKLSRSFLSYASWAPDGRWITFKDSLGTTDVYALDTQHPAERYPLSEDEGEEPIWSHRGDEIVFRRGWSWMSVHVDTTRSPRFSAPRRLFDGPFINVPGWSHDVTADGRHHLLLIGPEEQTTTRLKLVTGWFGELRRVAPDERE